MNLKHNQEEQVKNEQETKPPKPGLEQDEANIGMKTESQNITDDPAYLPEIIIQQIRDYLGIKDHTKITLNVFSRKEDGTYFSKVHLRRKLMSGKTISRPWIILNKKN